MRSTLRKDVAALRERGVAAIAAAELLVQEASTLCLVSRSMRRGEPFPVAAFVLHRRFGPRPRQVRTVRAYVERAAMEAGVDIGVAALAASELATNVVQHARTFFTVSVIRSPGHLRVEFADGSRCPPVLQRAPRGEDGRGLLVVDAVADAWGAELTQSGKVVWFELQH